MSNSNGWGYHRPRWTSASPPDGNRTSRRRLRAVRRVLPILHNFDLLMDGRVIGHMNRKFQLRDRYVLDLSGDHERALDRRLAIALAIGLDTLQNR